MEIFFSNDCHSCAQIVLCVLVFQGWTGRVIFRGGGRAGQDEKKLQGSTGQYTGMGLKLRAAAKVECFHGSGQGGVRMPFF